MTARRPLTGEQGLSLVELLVAMALLAVVTSLVVFGVVSVHRGYRFTNQDSVSLAALRTSVDRFEKEVRQARRIYSDSSNKLVHIWVDYDRDHQQDLAEKINWKIEDLGADRARFIRYTDAAPTAITLMSRDLVFDASDTNFGYSTADPIQSSTISVLLEARGEGLAADSRTVQTEVRLRNYAL